MIAVIVMFFSFDVSLTELWEYITKAGYWLAAILGLWCVLYLMKHGRGGSLSREEGLARWASCSC